MSIVIIDCYVDGVGYPNFVSILESLTNQTLCVWQVAKEPCHIDISKVKGIVISGSAASVVAEQSLFPWLPTLEQFLQDAIALGIPCFGICFGHQILAKLCGANVGHLLVNDRRVPEVGWKTLQHVDHSVFQGIPSTFEAFLSHEDAVLSLPKDCEILASSQQCAIQSFRHHHKAIWGIQFHPEMPKDECLSLLQWRLQRHPDLLVEMAKEERMIQSNPLRFQFFTNFLNMCAL